MTHPQNNQDSQSGRRLERHVSADEVTQALTSGIVFKGRSLSAPTASKSGVKTKAKKKSYVAGAHGSGAAKKKADIRERRANRHKK